MLRSERALRLAAMRASGGRGRHPEEVTIMVDVAQTRERVHELAARAWDVRAFEARYRTLLAEGISRVALDPETLVAQARTILDRIQRKAEEYEYLGHN